MYLEPLVNRNSKDQEDELFWKYQVVVPWSSKHRVEHLNSQISNSHLHQIQVIKQLDDVDGTFDTIRWNNPNLHKESLSSHSNSMGDDDSSCKLRLLKE